MTEESNKTLYILTNDGGWAEDVDEENEVLESTKTKAWNNIEKPEVVPIGTADFEIKDKNQTQDQGRPQRYQNNGTRNNNPRFRNEQQGKPNFFKKDRRDGDRYRGDGERYRGDGERYRGDGERYRNDGEKYRGERRQNGKQDDGSKWERKPSNNRTEDTRSRKPLVLAPRTVSDGKESLTPTKSEQKESPFGLATPKVTGKEVTETAPSNDQQPTENNTHNDLKEQQPKNEQRSRNFGSSNNPFSKNRNNHNKKNHRSNDRQTNSDGFQTQTRNRGNRNDGRSRADYKKKDVRVTEESKPATIDTNTRNMFSILSEE